MDKLNGDFNRGYTTALVNVLNFFDEHSDALKANRMYNQKSVHAVLDFLLNNREELRENGAIENVIVSRDKNVILIRKGA